MNNTDLLRPSAAPNALGLAAFTGGLLFFLDFVVIGTVLRLHPHLREYGALPPGRAALWVIVSLGLMMAPVGLLRIGVLGGGRTRRIGVTGVALAILGGVSYICGTVFIYFNPDRGTRQFFTPLGSVLLTLGMVLIYVSVLRAKVWRDWRRHTPLLVWIYFPLQFPIQAFLFLGENRGPNPFVLGCWGLCWAFLGYVIWRPGSRPNAEPHSSRVPLSPQRISR